MFTERNNVRVSGIILLKHDSCQKIGTPKM